MNKSAKPSQPSGVLIQHQDNSRSLLLAGVAILVAGGAAITAWFLTRPALETLLPTGYQVLPPNVLMTASFSTDPAQWEQLRALGTSQSRALLDQQLLEWRDRLLTDQGLDYVRDIQPWVGNEVTVAVLPQNPTGSAGLPIVAVIPVANPMQAVQSLRTSTDRGGAPWQEREYNGAKIRERQGTDQQSMALTVLKNQFIVASPSAQVVEQVVDTVEGGITLKDTPGYQSAWSGIKNAEITPFANIFVNVPIAANTAAANTASPVQPDAFAQAQQNQGFILSASLGDQAIDIRGLSWLKPDSTRKLAVYNNARLMPKILPASTYMFLSGGNLKQIWREYDQGAKLVPNTLAPTPPKRLREGFNSLTGLDFDQDVLSWMGGEYALALIPAPTSEAVRSLGTGIAFFAQASDRRSAEQFFQKLGQAMTTRYQFQEKTAQIQGTPVISWLDTEDRLVATHGWLENNIAFLTAAAPIAETFVPKPTEPIETATAFSQGIPTGLNPNNGHFFLDVTQTIKNPMPNLPFLPSGNPILQAMESIGVTAAVRNEQSTRFDVKIKLRQEGEILPLPQPGESSDSETEAEVP